MCANGGEIGLLWVISGHQNADQSCPLSPNNGHGLALDYTFLSRGCLQGGASKGASKNRGIWRERLRCPGIGGIGARSNGAEAP
jgi:hypothetical protein